MATIYLQNAPFINKKFIVTTPFSSSHHALDLAPYGYAGSLYAIDNFTIIYSYTYHEGGSTYGNYFIASNGNNTMYLYAHLRDAPPAVGTVYVMGSYICEAGTTGHSTGVHLHLEMQSGTTWRYNQPASDYINPCTYLTGIINVASSSNVYICEGGPTPPTPVIANPNNKFKWVLYSRKLRNKRTN